MKSFETKEIHAAYDYSMNGGQALHLMSARQPPKGSPSCFSGRPFAHLLDQDRARLEATARRFGVRKIRVCGEGKKQHIDLVGVPLSNALKECDVQEGLDL